MVIFSAAFLEPLPAGCPPGPGLGGRVARWRGIALSSSGRDPGPGRRGDQLRSGAVFSGGEKIITLWNYRGYSPSPPCLGLTTPLQSSPLYSGFH